MSPFKDEWLAHQRQRFMRHDAHRFVRPDWERYVAPAFVPFYRAQFEGKANFNPNQPRVPAGNPDGGQWTSQGERLGGGQIGDDGGGGAGDGADDSERPVQLAYLGPTVRVVQKGIEAGLALFAWLSARNGPDGAAILAFPAEDFRTGADPSSSLVHVGRLTKDELGRACPRIGEVQSLTDRAAASVRREDYSSAATYGTAVHMRLRDDIRALKDPDLVTEKSLLKTLQETGHTPEDRVRYGQRGSIRIDVLENAGAGTVCVYDIKTGKRGLSRGRLTEIARSVYLHYPSAQRIVVTETRPRR
jgi:hypothetical protein